jgi:hypothetical protein
LLSWELPVRGAFGVWRVACGVWCMVNGVWCAGNCSCARQAGSGSVTRVGGTQGYGSLCYKCCRRYAAVAQRFTRSQSARHTHCLAPHQHLELIVPTPCSLPAPSVSLPAPPAADKGVRTFVDVGANVGWFSLLVAAQVRRIIHEYSHTRIRRHAYTHTRILTIHAPMLHMLHS